MNADTGLQLVILALIDSTSLGTLVIPLWLLLRRGTKDLARKVSLYLAVLGGFYFALGVVLLSGGHVVVDRYGDSLQALTQAPAFRWVALAIGIALIAFGFSGPWSKADREKAAAKKAEAARAKQARVGGAPVPGVANDDAARLAAVQGGWGSRIDSALRTPAALVGLALVAGLLEVPTMLPYLAASGILVASGLPLATQVLTLAGYCLVMMLPALVLFGARMALGRRADAWFARVGTKLGEYVSETAKWVAAIVGILVVRWATTGAGGVGFGDVFDQFTQR